MDSVLERRVPKPEDVLSMIDSILVVSRSGLWTRARVTVCRFNRCGLGQVEQAIHTVGIAGMFLSHSNEAISHVFWDRCGHVILLNC